MANLPSTQLDPHHTKDAYISFSNISKGRESAFIAPFSQNYEIFLHFTANSEAIPSLKKAVLIS